MSSRPWEFGGDAGFVFINEFDAIGRQRGAGMGGSSDEREFLFYYVYIYADAEPDPH